jgi:hypothetical protein
MDTVVLYLILLTPPGADPLIGLALDHSPTMCQAVERAAAAYELIDPRGYYGSDALLTNIRRNDLGDAPYTWVYTPVLPSHDAARANWLVAVAYARHIDGLAALHPAHADYYAPLIDEAQTLRQVWSLLDDASGRQFALTHRRAALRSLERILGRERCLAGDWPPPLPVWRFRRIGD